MQMSEDLAMCLKALPSAPQTCLNTSIVHRVLCFVYINILAAVYYFNLCIRLIAAL